MEIANRVAHKAGLPLFVIHETRRVEDYWLVKIITSVATYIVKIKADTGDVIEFGPSK